MPANCSRWNGPVLRCWCGGWPAFARPSARLCLRKLQHCWTSKDSAATPAIGARPRCWRWRPEKRAWRSPRPRPISSHSGNWPTCASWRARPWRRAISKRRTGSPGGCAIPVIGMPSPNTFSARQPAVRVCAVKRLLLFLLAGCSLGAAPAFAHTTSTSYLLIDAPRADGPVEVRWDLSLHDIVWSVFIDQDFDGVVTWQEVLDARKSSIEPSVLGQISLQRGGSACKPQVADVALAERASENHLSVLLTVECPKPGALRVGGPLFMSGDAAERVLLAVTRGDEKLTGGN